MVWLVVLAEELVSVQGKLYDPTAANIPLTRT